MHVRAVFDSVAVFGAGLAWSSARPSAFIQKVLPFSMHEGDRRGPERRPRHHPGGLHHRALHDHLRRDSLNVPRVRSLAPARPSLGQAHAVAARLPHRPRHRHLRARLRARRGHARQLRARRLGHPVLHGHRRVPLRPGPRLVPVALREARPGPALRGGRAGRRPRRRGLGAAALPGLRAPARSSSGWSSTGSWSWWARWSGSRSRS